jgi:general secretion pathway protein F
MRFLVRAVGNAGVVSVPVEAVDAEAARRHVVAKRLRPISIEVEAGTQKPWPMPAFPRPGRTSREFPLTIFTQELLGLLEAGLSLSEAIEALAEKEDGKTQTHGVLSRLTLALAEGRRFSDALEAIPETFPPLYVGLVRTAERTSNLPEALGRYLEYRSRTDAVRGRIVSALVYPAILLAVGLLVTAFLVGYVVPKFASVYQGTGRPMPWLSQWLLGWGSFAADHGWVLAPSAIVAIIAGALLLRRRLAEGGWLALLSRVPAIAPRIRIMELSRFYLALGTLLEGGLAIRPALALSANVLGAERRAQLAMADAAIARGESVSRAFEATSLATPVGLRLLRVGERSGRLGEMLGRAARFHDGEIARWLEVFAKTFEPLLMTGIGLIIGLIVVMLYLPIFDLAGSLQ